MFADRTNWNLETNRLAEALAQHRAAGKRVIDLTASNPTTCGFEYDNAAILAALSDPQALVYEPNPRGLESARRAVAAYYAGRAKSDAGTGERTNEVPVDDIFLTTSTSEAYSFVFRTLCNPGDEILIPQPSYPLFDFIADIQDVKLVRYPLVYDHGWQIDFHSLEQAITPRTRGVIVVHPNNPTGHFCKRHEMAKLNGICSAHQMALIADEVFLDYVLDTFADSSEGSGVTVERRSVHKQPATFATNTEALTFTMSGLSKICGLPQMKVAWLVVGGPEPLKSQAIARLEVIADTYLSMNTPVQLAIPAFLEQRHGFQRQLMAHVQGNLAELDRQLAGQESCSRSKTEGGWYAVLRVASHRSGEQFAADLLTTKGVYVHPGYFYGFTTEGYLIVSLITTVREFAEGTRLMFSVS